MLDRMARKNVFRLRQINATTGRTVETCRRLAAGIRGRTDTGSTAVLALTEECVERRV